MHHIISVVLSRDRWTEMGWMTKGATTVYLMSAGDVMYEMSEQMIIIMMDWRHAQNSLTGGRSRHGLTSGSQTSNPVLCRDTPKTLQRSGWEETYSWVEGCTTTGCVSMCVFSCVLECRYLHSQDWTQRNMCVWERKRDIKKGRGNVTRGLMEALSSFILITIVADLSVTLATVAVG